MTPALILKAISLLDDVNDWTMCNGLRTHMQLSKRFTADPNFCSCQKSQKSNLNHISDFNSQKKREFCGIQKESTNLNFESYYIGTITNVTCSRDISLDYQCSKSNKHVFMDLK